MSEPGTLYIVATPIGHLGDMTFRAVETLNSVDWIACEDTRQSRKLLDHYGITRPLLSYHEHNEQSRTAELIARIESGLSGALISDAGTPLVSDPGFRIVRAAIEHGIRVVPIPGACAAVTALSAAGLPSDVFRFCGFLPRKSGERQSLLAAAGAGQETLIFYEAPHRILESLEEIARLLGDPPIVAAREVTKMHEEFLRGRASEVHAQLAARPAIKGEFTLLIGPRDPLPLPEESIPDAVSRKEKEGLSRMDAIKTVARERGLSKRDVYRLVEIEA
jgi:16S rRNA (cytidine1402-2'-O)-methyltransferase